MDRHWKVGELAAATGLTVRTLHHWEEQGLVTPSRRTASGHRLYGESDVRRVYEVVALRELGLSLEAVAGVLGDRGPALTEILEAHVTQVRRQLAALRSLETTLSALAHQARRSGCPSVPDLLTLIDEVSTMTETFRQYFTEEQLAALAQRRERFTTEEITEVENEWPPLISEMTAAMEGGVDPAEPRIQALAARWMELVAAFDGGDPGIREANRRMLTDNPGCGPSEELIAYVTRANAARAAGG